MSEIIRDRNHELSVTFQN